MKTELTVAVNPHLQITGALPFRANHKVSTLAAFHAPVKLCGSGCLTKHLLGVLLIKQGVLMAQTLFIPSVESALHRAFHSHRQPRPKVNVIYFSALFIEK